MTIGMRPQFGGYTPHAVPHGDGATPARVFYAIDSRRVTMREYWWGSKASVLVLPLLKLFRIPSATDDPNVESLASFAVQAVPGIVAQRFALPMQQLKALGFHSPLWHVIDDDVHRVKTTLVTLCHESGRMWARIHQRVWGMQVPAKTVMFCEIVSELGNGRFLWSLSSKPDLVAPPTSTVVRLVGASPSRLLAAHQSSLTTLGADPVHLITTADELREGVERHHATVRDHHLARGVFAPLTVDQRQTAVAFRSSVKSAEDEGSRHPEILAEIDRLQNTKASRASGVILLLVSVALFVGAGMTNFGGGRFSAELLVILVALLFFHEMGHWVAMRLFGYRNLKMFFIPFFGAAVTGRHYNVPGWKKAIVSLMGPLPGLVVGAALGGLGVMYDQPLLVTISMVALLLNGFNLLPILPLDGGWIVQAILFSRHHLLELLFRLAALAALFLMAVVTSDRVLAGLCIVMAVSLPAMYKLARITNELRKAHLPPGSDDGQTLPQATADAIVDRIKAAFPTKLNNRMAAHHTLHVFENLNARPPGILASIGFGIMQFGSIAAAAVIASLIFFRGPVAGDMHALDPSSLEVVRTPGDSALALPRKVVIATFPKLEAVADAVGELQRGVSPEMAIERLGQTVLVALPLGDVDGLRDVQSSLERRGASAFVATPDEPVRMQLSCTATSAAAGKSLEQDLAGYLNRRGLDLLPPWQPGVPPTPEEAVQRRRARDTYLTLGIVQREAHGDSAAMALGERMDVAEEAGDTAEVARLDAQRLERVAGLQRARIAGLRSAPGADTALIDAFAASELEAGDSTSLLRRAALVGPLLGQLPLVDGRPAPATAQWAASGFVGAANASITLPQLRFTNAFQGPPALVRWLLANGCGDIKYNFVAPLGRAAARGGGLTQG